MKGPRTRIYFGDSRDMAEVEDSSVDLMVTSPPYWHIKDYEVKEQIGYGQSLHQYLTDLYDVWKECARVIKKGRRLCVNIGDQFARGSVYGRYKIIPLHAEVIVQMERLGLDFMGDIIWRKRTTMNTTGGASIMGSYPYPPNGILEIDYEHILVFRAPGKPKKADKERKTASKLDKERWKKLHLSHWTFGGERQKGHEAMFPVELPGRLIEMYSLVGDTVLDPFMGSGTTARAAMELDRNCIGYEINDSFKGTMLKRIGEIGSLDFSRSTGKGNRTIESYYGPAIMDLRPKLDPNKERKDAEVQYRKVKEFTSMGKLIFYDGSTVSLMGIEITDEKGCMEYLKRYVKGKHVEVREDPDHGPEKAYVYLKNRIFVNGHMIRSGLARTDRSYDFSMKDRFLKYERERK